MTSAPTSPSVDGLLAEAIAEAGHDDFGPGDFRAGLAVLLESLEQDAGLAPSSLDAVTADFRRRLVNRLDVEAWYRDHPEIADLPLHGPIDITGLPRTGTTALANMLSLDPRFRCLRHWEQQRPCPPPEVDSEADDPRRLAMLVQNEHMPSELKAMHIFDADSTAEDTELLGMAFHGQQFTLPVYGYHRWWREADLTSTFEYHRRVLKLLQSRRPPDLWLFKAPHHSFHLEALVAAYPEARFVMTHRDPASAVASYASLVSALFPATEGPLDLHRLGREVDHHLRVCMERAIAARARLGEDRFVDVHHRELVTSPMQCVRRVYAELGLELHPSVDAAIDQWRSANRPGGHGTHRYSAEQFGLDADAIREEFAFYISHFDIEIDR